MVYRRGDVVLVPVPFTDLRQRKVRPAVVLSGPIYHATEPDLILGAITTNLNAAASPVDYLLVDWRIANLKLPSAFKPVIFSIEPSLILYRIGQLSKRDLDEIGRRMVHALELTTASLQELVTTVELTQYPVSQVQALAERAIEAVLFFSASKQRQAQPGRLLALLRAASIS